ncbi:hypothetical protein [Isobaculum melis]|uniref:Uncharacterized protein n=1 Tax=Isobaculum melis TaxID=142588 RepID=A0A1H9T1D5_9LACT|nr:hypothetical protein [Isobaculum melis]SER90453.1 hypothetical protein SAMN04488559_11024 [Isobaculum melis]
MFDLGITITNTELIKQGLFIELLLLIALSCIIKFISAPKQSSAFSSKNNHSFLLIGAVISIIIVMIYAGYIIFSRAFISF